MFCNKCGKEIEDGAKSCPNCGENFVQTSQKTEKKKKKKVGCICGLVIIIAMIAMIAVIIGSDDGSTTATSDIETSTSQTEKKDYPVIYEDNYVKVSYIKVFSDETVDQYVEGVAYLQLRVENKSKQTFTVSMTKAAINGMSTTIGSGLPMTILPGNSSEQPFILFTKNTGVSNADDIEKLQFSLYLFDENINSIEETKNISIKIK